jgi:hypothetical protein
MPEYLSPGIYVEEVDRGPKPIEAVGTAMAVFIGFSEKAEITETLDGEAITTDLLNRPQLVTNWTQFTERFGSFVTGAYMPHAVYGYFTNGGSRCYVLSVKTIPRAQSVLLNTEGKPKLIVQARQAGFDGMRLRVKVEVPEGSAEVAEGEEGTAGGSSDGLQPFDVVVEKQGRTGAWIEKERVRQVQLVEQEQEDGSNKVAVAYRNNRSSKLINLVIPENGTESLAQLWPRSQEQTLGIQDQLISPATYADYQGDAIERTGLESLAELDDATMVIVPDLMNVPPGEKLDLVMVKAVQSLIISHCESMSDRVAILDSPPNMNPQQIKKWRMDTAGYDSSYAALYYPWIEIMDPVTNAPMTFPPSGHIAGVWARNDNTRGVHKAPANEVVQGAIGLTRNLTKGEHDTLNPDGINVIRAFPGMGIRIWGARTLSSDASWRYINVRRLFNMIKKSIERGTMWAVFEPNDPRLWGRLSRDISSFLATVWATGALFGSTPSESFFVKCDAELNPSESRDLGRLIMEVGISPVKPAEFVIFRISQWAEGS